MQGSIKQRQISHRPEKAKLAITAHESVGRLLDAPQIEN